MLEKETLARFIVYGTFWNVMSFSECVFVCTTNLCTHKYISFFWLPNVKTIRTASGGKSMLKLAHIIKIRYMWRNAKCYGYWRCSTYMFFSLFASQFFSLSLVHPRIFLRFFLCFICLCFPFCTIWFYPIWMAKIVDFFSALALLFEMCDSVSVYIYLFVCARFFSLKNNFNNLISNITGDWMRWSNCYVMQAHA